MYQQWSVRDNSRRAGERSEVDQISLLIARADAMQKALDKMSVKAVAHHRPQSCSWCGDLGHVYAYCPSVQGDEESEQLYYFSNFEPQPTLPEQFIIQAEIDFMHEQSKINQMMFEHMQAVGAQLADLAAHSIMIGNQMSQQATTAPQPRGQLPSQLEPLPEETVTHTDRVEYTRSAQKEEKGNEKACAVAETHGPHASHTDRARQGMGNDEAHGLHKFHTGEAHGPDTYHTDRALAVWSLLSVPRYFRPPRCAEIHPTHHPPPLHHSLHVW